MENIKRGRGRRISYATRKKIIALRVQGKPYHEIIKELNVSRGTVTRWINRHMKDLSINQGNIDGSTPNQSTSANTKRISPMVKKKSEDPTVDTSYDNVKKYIHKNCLVWDTTRSKWRPLGNVTIPEVVTSAKAQRIISMVMDNPYLPTTRISEDPTINVSLRAVKTFLNNNGLFWNKKTSKWWKLDNVNSYSSLNESDDDDDTANWPPHKKIINIPIAVNTRGRSEQRSSSKNSAGVSSSNGNSILHNVSNAKPAVIAKVPRVRDSPVATTTLKRNRSQQRSNSNKNIAGASNSNDKSISPRRSRSRQRSSTRNIAGASNSNEKSISSRRSRSRQRSSTSRNIADAKSSNGSSTLFNRDVGEAISIVAGRLRRTLSRQRSYSNKNIASASCSVGAVFNRFDADVDEFDNPVVAPPRRSQSLQISSNKHNAHAQTFDISISAASRRSLSRHRSNSRSSSMLFNISNMDIEETSEQKINTPASATPRRSRSRRRSNYNKNVARASNSNRNNSLFNISDMDIDEACEQKDIIAATPSRSRSRERSNSNKNVAGSGSPNGSSESFNISDTDIDEASAPRINTLVAVKPRRSTSRRRSNSNKNVTGTNSRKGSSILFNIPDMDSDEACGQNINTLVAATPRRSRSRQRSNSDMNIAGTSNNKECNTDIDKTLAQEFDNPVAATSKSNKNYIADVMCSNKSSVLVNISDMDIGKAAPQKIEIVAGRLSRTPSRKESNSDKNIAGASNSNDAAFNRTDTDVGVAAFTRSRSGQRSDNNINVVGASNSNGSSILGVLLNRFNEEVDEIPAIKFVKPLTTSLRSGRSHQDNRENIAGVSGSSIASRRSRSRQRSNSNVSFVCANNSNGNSISSALINRSVEEVDETFAQNLKIPVATSLRSGRSQQAFNNKENIAAVSGGSVALTTSQSRQILNNNRSVLKEVDETPAQNSVATNPRSVQSHQVSNNKENITAISRSSIPLRRSRSRQRSNSNINFVCVSNSNGKSISSALINQSVEEVDETLDQNLQSSVAISLRSGRFDQASNNKENIADVSGSSIASRRSRSRQRSNSNVNFVSASNSNGNRISSALINRSVEEVDETPTQNLKNPVAASLRSDRSQQASNNKENIAGVRGGSIAPRKSQSLQISNNRNVLEGVDKTPDQNLKNPVVTSLRSGRSDQASNNKENIAGVSDGSIPPKKSQSLQISNNNRNILGVTGTIGNSILSTLIPVATNLRSGRSDQASNNKENIAGVGRSIAPRRSPSRQISNNNRNVLEDVDETLAQNVENPVATSLRNKRSYQTSNNKENIASVRKSIALRRSQSRQISKNNRSVREEVDETPTQNLENPFTSLRSKRSHQASNNKENIAVANCSSSDMNSVYADKLQQFEATVADLNAKQSVLEEKVSHYEELQLKQATYFEVEMKKFRENNEQLQRQLTELNTLNKNMQTGYENIAAKLLQHFEHSEQIAINPIENNNANSQHTETGAQPEDECDTLILEGRLELSSLSDLGHDFPSDSDVKIEGVFEGGFF